MHFPKLTGFTGIFKYIYILYAFLQTDRVYRYIYICLIRFSHLYLYIYMSQLDIQVYLSVYIYLPAECTGIFTHLYVHVYEEEDEAVVPSQQGVYDYICARMDLLMYSYVYIFFQTWYTDICVSRYMSSNYVYRYVYLYMCIYMCMKRKTKLLPSPNWKYEYISLYIYFSQLGIQVQV